MLREYGGMTPDGRPLWRLIRASNKRIRAAGVMRTLAKGCDSDTPVFDRIEEGVFWVPRYRFDGWILERWFPGPIWGTEEDWSTNTAGADGQTRMMPAWPRHGDYYMLAGPWRTIEAAGDLKVAIRENMRSMAARPKDWEGFLRQQMAEERLEREHEVEEFERAALAASRGEAMPLLGSLSAAAQRVRNGIAEAIGGPDWHLGAA